MASKGKSKARKQLEETTIAKAALAGFGFREIAPDMANRRVFILRLPSGADGGLFLSRYEAAKFALEHLDGDRVFIAERSPRRGVAIGALYGVGSVSAFKRVLGGDYLHGAPRRGERVKPRGPAGRNN